MAARGWPGWAGMRREIGPGSCSCRWPWTPISSQKLVIHLVVNHEFGSIFFQDRPRELLCSDLLLADDLLAALAVRFRVR